MLTFPQFQYKIMHNLSATCATKSAHFCYNILITLYLAVFGTSWAVVDKNIHTIGAKQADLKICFHENCCLRNLVFWKNITYFRKNWKISWFFKIGNVWTIFANFFGKNEHFRKKEILWNYVKIRNFAWKKAFFYSNVDGLN